MADLTLFHNPKCSTSRRALDLLEAEGAEFDIVLYLKTPPSRADLERIVARLDGDVADLVRHDKRFGELGLDPDAYTDAAAVIDLLVEHPELLQRPLLETPGRVVIGRPVEVVVPAVLGSI